LNDFCIEGDESNIIDSDVYCQDIIDLSIKIDELAFHEIKLNPVKWDEGMKTTIFLMGFKYAQKVPTITCSL